MKMDEQGIGSVEGEKGGEESEGLRNDALKAWRGPCCWKG